MGVLATFPKNPGQATVWGKRDLKEPVALHCQAGLGAFPFPPCKCSLEEEGPDPAVCWEPLASLCLEAENPDCKEDIHHVPRLASGLWLIANQQVQRAAQGMVPISRAAPHCKQGQKLADPSSYSVPSDLGWRGGCFVLSKYIPSFTLRY